MQDDLQRIVAQMPQTLSRDAPAMIGRTVEALQALLARDAHLPNISYCSLLVRLGTTDLTREFVAALSDAASQLSRPAKASAAGMSTFGLSLELVGGADVDPSRDTMRESTELFQQVLAAAKAQGVRGLEAYGKDFFLAALRRAFLSSRFDEENVTRLMPYACRALDAELLRLYRGIDTVSRSAPR